MAYNDLVPDISSIKINGKCLTDFKILIPKGSYPDALLLPPVRTQLYTVPGKPGSKRGPETWDNWEFTLDLVVRGSNHYDMVTNRDDFIHWITNKDLLFELSFHRYYYEDGTIGITDASKEIAGTDTLFTSYAYPGAQLKYINSTGSTITTTISSVESDTTLFIEDASSETASGLTYQLERRRYLECRYNGYSSLVPFESAPSKASSYQMSISFLTTKPYFFGDEFHSDSTLAMNTTPSYYKVLGSGLEPSNPTLVIDNDDSGGVDYPVIIVPEYIFSYDGLTHTCLDIDNSELEPADGDECFIEIEDTAPPYFDSSEVSFSFYMEFFSRLYDGFEDTSATMFTWVKEGTDQGIKVKWDITNSAFMVYDGTTGYQSDRVEVMDNGKYYLAGAFKATDASPDQLEVKLAVNGKLLIDQTQNLESIFSNMDNLDNLFIGSSNASPSYKLIGKITKFALYPRLFTESELLYPRTIEHNNPMLTVDDQGLKHPIYLDMEEMKAYLHDGTNFTSHNNLLSGDRIQLVPDTNEESMLYLVTTTNAAYLDILYKPRWI